MSLHAVCIEVRRKLQCANIYLTFNRSISNCEDAVKILLKPNEIKIKYDEVEDVVNLSSLFSIDQTSISSLVIEGHNVSFRVVLSNETGSLDILFDDDLESEEQKIVNTAKDEIEVTIDKGEMYQLKCANCENNLFKDRRTFSRILELPSEFIGMSEWFCHKHHGHVEHDLTPKLDDIFYGLYFVAINLNNLCNVKSKDKFFYCKRCLKFLGEKIYKGNALKLWNDSVILDANGCKQQMFIGDYVDGVGNIIAKILKENLVTSKLHSMQFVKILFEATFPNRKHNYLMLNILERSLEVLANFNVEDCDEITLEDKKALKVLFKVEDNLDHPLVNFWSNDFNVQNVTISHKMFTGFVKVLQDNTKLVPETYRYNNGFSLSYFFIKGRE